MLVSLTRSQLMALRSLLLEHLMCPRRTEVYIDCSQQPAVETTPEQLLVAAVNAGPALTAEELKLVALTLSECAADESNVRMQRLALKCLTLANEAAR